MELIKKHLIQDNFIGIFDNFFKDDFFNKVINYFEFCEKLKMHHGRYDEERRKDKAIVINPLWQDPKESTIDSKELLLEFSEIFYKEIYPLYLQKFPQLKTSSNTIYDLKIQKTLPAEGYHIFHYENDNKEVAYRQTTFILYLNDIKEGGETEFLYQSCRISPKRNRLVLWPAGFTHVHRGNPPLKETKYIATGWTILVK